MKALRSSKSFYNLFLNNFKLRTCLKKVRKILIKCKEICLSLICAYLINVNLFSEKIISLIAGLPQKLELGTHLFLNF